MNLELEIEEMKIWPGPIWIGLLGLEERPGQFHDIKEVREKITLVLGINELEYNV